ncbi:MAG: tetratricopeptide repeat protein [Alphaproteobacteria bacterium]
MTREDNRQARDLLYSAIEIEPDNAATLALYSEALLRMWINGWSDRPEAELADSFSTAKRADEIDDQDSRTQTALGQAYLYQRELEKAKRHFELALRLNPNDTRVLVYYSRQAVSEGNTERAVALCHQAVTLNHYGKYSWNLGVACFVARRYGETVEHLESIRNPAETVLAILAASYAMGGDDAKAASTHARFSEAAKASPHLSRLSGSEDWRDYYAARWPFRNHEDLQHLLEALGKAGFPI